MDSCEVIRCDVTTLECVESSPSERTKLALRIRAKQMTWEHTEDEPDALIKTIIQRWWLWGFIQSPERVRVHLSGTLDRIFFSELSGAGDVAVDTILNHCLREALEWPQHGAVIWLSVEIDLRVNDIPEIMDDNDDDGIGFVAASDESIKNLETVRVEASGEECAVCYEEISAGSEATRLPCSHHFHGDCVVKWLMISKFCPLCRFEMTD